MFERAITINQFLLSSLRDVVADIPAERLYERPPGNGHPPVWVLGHLAVCAEMGLQIFGERPRHPAWMKMFGPGSSDDIPASAGVERQELLDSIHSQYADFHDRARSADSRQMEQPHGIALLEGSALTTTGDVVAHLLSSHFAFHLAQLSGWRRAAGHGPLF